MNITQKQLTPIEVKYAQRHFKKYRKMVNWLWLVYLFIFLMGFVFIFSDIPIVGIFLSGVGLLGAVFFKKNSVSTTFELQKKTYQHTGQLNNIVRRVGRVSVVIYRLDEYPLVLPGAMDMYFATLEEKYEHTPVAMTFAVMKITKKNIEELIYAPIFMKGELNIQRAIEKNGERFLTKDKIYLYGQIFSFLVLLPTFFFMGFWIFDQFDIADNIVVVGILSVGSLFLALKLVTKLFNQQKISQDQRDRFT